MGILVNENQMGGPSNTSHNIGDIFYTTRTDNSLNGAVECNGSQYNFSDFDSNLQSLFEEGKLPYLPIGEFDSMVTNQCGCDSFGYGTSDSSVVEIYAWGISYSISPYPETVYTTTDNPVEEDIVYELSDGVITELGTVAIKQSSTTIRVRFENGTEIAGWNRQTGSDTTAELVQPFSPTTYFKVPKKLSRVLVRTQKPTADNNYTWYNVYADGWVEQGGRYRDKPATVPITLPIAMNDAYYFISVTPGTNVENSGSYESGFYSATTTTIGIAGIANVNNNNGKWEVKGYADSTEYTKDKWNYQNIQVERCMVQLFNSTTDTAVATCNQVLSDISTLNQGDYVVYWDSYEASDHSHAYTGITLDEYQWYRIYKSGWVEQGGEYVGDTINSPIALPLSMSSSHYQVVVHLVENGPYSSDNGTAVINSCFTVSGAINDRSQTQFVLSYPTTDSGRTYMWQVSGFSFLA